MPNYNDGKIYKLCSTIDNTIYVGSTTYTLEKRMYGHYSRCLHEEKYNHFNIIGWKNVRIELLELYPSKSHEQLRKREKYWCNLLKPSLNLISPHTNRKEYKTKYDEQHKEQIQAQSKEYRERNKDKIVLKGKVYREQNHEAIIKFQKEWRERNKEEKNRKDREWAAQRVHCPHCDVELCKASLPRHTKTYHTS